jgi:hypothetical protein
MMRMVMRDDQFGESREDDENKDGAANSDGYPDSL